MATRQGGAMYWKSLINQHQARLLYCGFAVTFLAICFVLSIALKYGLIDIFYWEILGPFVFFIDNSLLLHGAITSIIAISMILAPVFSTRAEMYLLSSCGFILWLLIGIVATGVFA